MAVECGKRSFLRAKFGHFWPFSTLFENLHGLMWVKNNSKKPLVSAHPKWSGNNLGAGHFDHGWAPLIETEYWDRAGWGGNIRRYTGTRGLIKGEMAKR